MNPTPRRIEPLTLLIGVSMTIGYGTLYYPFAILGPEIARTQGWSNSLVFGVFSAALLTSAVTASIFGHAMDRFGARPVMVVGSIVAAFVLVNLSLVETMVGFAVAMLLIEFAARMVQYEAGFAALTAIHGRNARRPIAHVTLVAGFASTVFWPPIHMLVPNRPSARAADQNGGADPQTARVGGSVAKPSRDPGLLHPGRRMPAFVLLSLAFAGGSFLMSAVHTSFFLILDQMGRAAALAAVAGAVIGPMQVAARVIEMVTGERVASSMIGLISTGTLFLGIVILTSGLWLQTDMVIIAFAVSFGVGQGLNFIARAILPARLFGTDGYGAMTGKLATIRLFAMAGAPFCTALALTHAGIGATFAMLTAIAAVSVAASWVLWRIEERAGRAHALASAQ